MNFNVKCPKCKKSYKPYGAFMLEKCYCPHCGNRFSVIKGARIIRVLYMILTFTILTVLYTTIKPETSIVIAIFWLSAMLILKVGTYLMHLILLITWNLFMLLKKVIFKNKH